MKKFLLFFALLSDFFSPVLLFALGSAEEKTTLLGGKHNMNIRFESVEKEHWINVFIHGSHGSFLGLLSLPKVLNDQSSGTFYEKIQTSWRRHAPVFCANRLMGNQGLTRVDSAWNNQTSITFALIKAYLMFVGIVK